MRRSRPLTRMSSGSASYGPGTDGIAAAPRITSWRAGVEQQQAGAAQRVVLFHPHLDGRERAAGCAAPRRSGRAERRTRPPSRRSCTPTSHADAGSSSTRPRWPARASGRPRPRCASRRDRQGRRSGSVRPLATSISPRRSLASPHAGKRCVVTARASVPGHRSSSSMRTRSW